MIRSAALLLGLLAAPALGQEAGWHFSPLLGEGDRAALGCNREATAEAYLCLAVRCEDDYGIGLYLHGNRPIGLGDDWTMTIDREFTLPLQIEGSDAPYGARIGGDVTGPLEALKNGGIAYLDASDGSVSAQIPLAGSLNAINRALYYCAPRQPPSGDEEATVDGDHGAGDEAGEGRAEE